MVVGQRVEKVVPRGGAKAARQRLTEAVVCAQRGVKVVPSTLSDPTMSARVNHVAYG